MMHREVEPDLSGKSANWPQSLISEVIADYLFIVDVKPGGELHLSWVSEKLTGNTGRTESEIAFSDSWMQIIHPEDKARFQDFVKQMISVSEKGELECRSFHKDGHERWIRISARRRNGPDGKPVQLIGAVREITEQKKVELQYLRSEEKYRKLHASMTDAFCSVNMDGQLLESNKAYQEMLGYSEEELLDLTYVDLTPAKWHAKEAAIVENEIIPNGSSGVYEKEYIRKDGSLIPVELRTFLIRDDNGNPAAMWAIVRDISDRKLVEEKLKSAIEEKETLLREVHHRVKNNLQTVMTLIQVRSPQVTDPQALTIIKEMQEQIRTISVIYQELFQSEKLSRVKMQPYLELLLSYLLKSFQLDKKVRISVDCGEHELAAELAMPCGLIINELVTNALKYAFPGEPETEPEISVTLQDEEGGYVLRVKDNGRGISASQDFENPVSTGFQLVNLWARNQMNGTVEISNHTGTCFTIRFKT